MGPPPHIPPRRGGGAGGAAGGGGGAMTVGSVGGACIMNAGCYGGETWNIVKKVLTELGYLGKKTQPRRPPPGHQCPGVRAGEDGERSRCRRDGRALCAMGHGHL